MLDSISRHNSKTLHVFRIFDFDLEPAQIFENVPSPVLAKSPTGIGQFANWYWPICQPVLAKSPTGIDQIANSFLGIQFHQWLVISSIPVGDLVNTGWRIGQYRLANWSIPVGKLANTSWRIGQYRLANWPRPVDDFRMSAMVHFEQVCHYLMRTFTFNCVWPIIYQLKVPFRSEKKLT